MRVIESPGVTLLSFASYSKIHTRVLATPIIRSKNRLCWLLGASVLKIDDFALDLLIFLGAVAFTDEGMQEHFVCLHPSCRNMRSSSSPSVGDERVEVPSRQFKNTKICGTQSLQVLRLVS